jgi:hypothetical protein
MDSRQWRAMCKYLLQRIGYPLQPPYCSLGQVFDRPVGIWCLCPGRIDLVRLRSSGVVVEEAVPAGNTVMGNWDTS